MPRPARTRWDALPPAPSFFMRDAVPRAPRFDPRFDPSAPRWDDLATWL